MGVLKEVITTYIEEDGKIKITETPLVRCGECKHYAFGSCSKLHLIVSDDDFCSDGERRSQ